MGFGWEVSIGDEPSGFREVEAAREKSGVDAERPLGARLYPTREAQAGYDGLLSVFVRKHDSDHWLCIVARATQRLKINVFRRGLTGSHGNGESHLIRTPVLRTHFDSEQQDVQYIPQATGFVLVICSFRNSHTIRPSG